MRETENIEAIWLGVEVDGIRERAEGRGVFGKGKNLEAFMEEVEEVGTFRER